MQIKGKIQLIIKRCRSNGWIVKFNSKHYRVHLPNGKVVVVSATPSDPNVIDIILRDFKHAGYIINI